MTARAARCGNDPRGQLTPGDQVAVDEFKAMLLKRRDDELADRTQTRWWVEIKDTDGWRPAASPSSTIPEAEGKLAGVQRRHRLAVLRIVRETTSYAYEETP